MKPIIVVALMCAACASHDPPYVYVTGDRAQLGVDEVAAWDLGFAPGLEDAGLPECSRTWYSDTFGETCQITIRLAFVPDLTDDDCANKCQINGRADSDARLVEVNATLKFTDEQIRHIVLHETGHILLDSMHLESYLNPTWQPIGVMQAHPTDYPTTPSANDYALACYTLGICKETL